MSELSVLGRTVSELILTDTVRVPPFTINVNQTVGFQYTVPAGYRVVSVTASPGGGNHGVTASWREANRNILFTNLWSGVINTETITFNVLVVMIRI